jgi:hypothetical protein
MCRKELGHAAVSKGPGRIERAIRALFDAHPDLAFVTDEIAEHCYPNARPIERKHQVATLRAAHRVVANDPDWTGARAKSRGTHWVFYNRGNLQSYSLGRLIAGSFVVYRSQKRSEEAERCLDRWAFSDSNRPGPMSQVIRDRAEALQELYDPGHSYVSYMSPPNGTGGLCDGMWLAQVQQHVAYRDGDAEMRAAIDARREREREAWLAMGSGKRFPPVGDTRQETLTALAERARSLIVQNDPDTVRDGLAAIAGELETMAST